MEYLFIKFYFSFGTNFIEQRLIIPLNLCFYKMKLLIFQVKSYLSILKILFFTYNPDAYFENIKFC